MERQLLRIMAEDDVKEKLELKSSEYQDGFFAGCAWLNEYCSDVLKTYLGETNETSRKG